MAITRRYLCDCGYEWTKLHFDRADPVPDCPMCEARESAKQIPGLFAITGVKSKAIDFTQKMMEQDYGYTDFNDNSREGDIAAKAPPPVQTAEAETLTMAIKEAVPELSPEQAEMTKQFWMQGPKVSSPEHQALTSTAMASAQQTRSDGADPMELLHKGQKATGGRMKLDVIGRAKGG